MLLRNLSFVVLASPAFAECPPVPDRSADLDTLFEAARTAPDARAGQALSEEMWKIWTEAPDGAADALLQRGVSALRASDFLAAIETFDRLVAYCPDWAEGYNQRAFAHFLSGRFAAARTDLERVVEIDPRHVGALSGLALTLTALGEEAAAQDWLRRALALNPWIPERSLLKEPAGEEL